MSDANQNYTDADYIRLHEAHIHTEKRRQNLEAALKAVLLALYSLPTGHHSNDTFEQWLNGPMMRSVAGAQLALISDARAGV